MRVRVIDGLSIRIKMYFEYINKSHYKMKHVKLFEAWTETQETPRLCWADYIGDNLPQNVGDYGLSIEQSDEHGYTLVGSSEALSSFEQATGLMPAVTGFKN
jgi:hypothetical protein